MVSVITTTLACLSVAGIFMKIVTWRKNRYAALITGFPVFLSPVHITDAWWLMLYKILVPVLELLPYAWTNPWLSMAQIWSIWKIGHRPFDEVSDDSFILTTPNGNMLWTCDPLVVKQLLIQHDKSQVPVDIVKFYDIWGPTVGSVEGDEWRTHRKVITAAFTPATNTAVWKEASYQTQALVDHWIESGSVIPVVKVWTSKLALHVISGVFFHKSLKWLGYTHDGVPPAPGHRIPFEEALFTVVARLGTIFMTPRILLRFSGEAYIAFTEWTKYMQELREGAVSRIEEVAVKKNKSILESIVVAGTPGSTRPGDRPLPEESILGNIFFTLLAGHETTGNTLAFTLVLLATYPDCQRRLQEELDGQLGGRLKQDWTVEKDYQVLAKGYTGAILKEVLRLYCVVSFILRQTVATTTVVDSKGKSHVLPEKTLCLIDFAAAFRNPATSAEREISPERRAELHDSPAYHFDPSRWLEGNNDVETEDNGTPVYWPFGQGPRSCPGKAFAQVEMIAVMATIFKDYSLELVVVEESIKACNGDSELAWQKTRDRALRTLIDDVECNINIYLLKEVPIRLIRRYG